MSDQTGYLGKLNAASNDVLALINRCREHTDVPIGVGFGISSKEDMDFLRGHADMAIIGTAALKIWEQSGADGLRAFFKEMMA